MQSPVHFEDLEIGQVLRSDHRFRLEIRPATLPCQRAGRGGKPVWRHHLQRLPDVGGEFPAGVAGERAAGHSGTIDQLNWLKPVRPGDTLRVEMEVLEKRPSRSKPDRGFVRFKYTTFNQEDELVMTMECPQIVSCRT